LAHSFRFDVTLSADALLHKGNGPPGEPQARDNAMRVHEYCAEIRAFACLVDPARWELTLDRGIEVHETTSLLLTTLIFWIVSEAAAAH
jgi:hypothetical protein